LTEIILPIIVGQLGFSREKGRIIRYIQIFDEKEAL